MRYFISLTYKGTAYHGWQIQPNANTVQAEVQHALSILEQEKIELIAAGRTDTGVHAKEMVVHFDTEKLWDKAQFIFKMNSILPKDIAISDLKFVNNNFHARFSATSRTYQYHLSLNKNPFILDLSYHFFGNLSVESMNQAAQFLLGEHDFSCFSKSKTQTFTNNCTIEKAVWEDVGDELIFTIKANRFLRNMVRAIVGTLIEVGEGKREVSYIPELIASKNRSNAGTSVPASGLFLVHIEYPKEGFIR